MQIAAALLTFRGVQSGFDLLLGPGETAGTPSLAVTAVTIVLTFLAIELGYWTAHFAMHRIPALWEFHKVHHSAEVLTPLTEWRQHPLELMLFPVVIGATTAAVRAPMLHAFGPRAQLIDREQPDRHCIRLHHPALAPQRAAVLRDRLARPADPVARRTIRSTIRPGPSITTATSAFACRCGIGCSGPCACPSAGRAMSMGWARTIRRCERRRAACWRRSGAPRGGRLLLLLRVPAAHPHLGVVQGDAVRRAAGDQHVLELVAPGVVLQHGVGKGRADLAVEPREFDLDPDGAAAALRAARRRSPSRAGAFRRREPCRRDARRPPRHISPSWPAPRPTTRTGSRSACPRRPSRPRPLRLCSGQFDVAELQIIVRRSGEGGAATAAATRAHIVVLMIGRMASSSPGRQTIAGRS